HLVRGVAVARDPVGAHHHASDAAATQERRRRDVGQQRDRDAVLQELPRRQPRALQPRAGLVREDGALLSRFEGGPDDPQGRAVTGRRQAAGAPRTTISRMAWAVSRAERTVTISARSGSRRWSSRWSALSSNQRVRKLIAAAAPGRGRPAWAPEGTAALRGTRASGRAPRPP